MTAPRLPSPGAGLRHRVRTGLGVRPTAAASRPPRNTAPAAATRMTLGQRGITAGQ